MKLSEVRSVLEKDQARTAAMLEAVDLMERSESIKDILVLAEASVEQSRAKLAALQGSIRVAEESLDLKKQAVEAEVAAERDRVRKDLAGTHAALNEAMRLRKEENDAREREVRAHNELRAQWSKDDASVKQQYLADQAREKVALEMELKALRRQVEAAKADLKANQDAVRVLAASLAQASM